MSELETLRRRCLEWEALHALARELLRLEDGEEMLDALVRRSLEILGAERGFLVLSHGQALSGSCATGAVKSWRPPRIRSAGRSSPRSFAAASRFWSKTR